MKLASSLIVSIFYTILLATVKTTPTRKDLVRQAEKDYKAKDLTKTINVEAESSVNPQIQKNKEKLELKLKNTKETDKGDKAFNKSEYNKEYYRKHKEKLRDYKRNYRKQNREKMNENQLNYYKRNKEKSRQYLKSYYQKNKEKLLKINKTYKQNNKEKWNEYNRKYRLKKKKIQSDNNEGTSFVNQQSGDFTNKGKLPIVCEEEGNLCTQVEKECDNGEDENKQIEVEEPNKTLEDATIDLNKKILPFDLNEIPDDQELQDY